MKTLIISGTVKKVASGKYLYDLMLYGQSNENPRVCFIRDLYEEFTGFDSMQEKARAMYAQYFQVTEFDIISFENLTMI